jgi:hypothetical protein
VGTVTVVPVVSGDVDDSDPGGDGGGGEHILHAFNFSFLVSIHLCRFSLSIPLIEFSHATGITATHQSPLTATNPPPLTPHTSGRLTTLPNTHT